MEQLPEGCPFELFSLEGPSRDDSITLLVRLLMKWGLAIEVCSSSLNIKYSGERRNKVS